MKKNKRSEKAEKSKKKERASKEPKKETNKWQEFLRRHTKAQEKKD